MAVRSLLAFLLLSIAENAVATSTVGTDSVATCDLTAVTQSSSQSVSVAAEAVGHVNSFLCGGNVSVPEEASAHALAVANSFVNAVVATTAECYAEGYASYKVNGGSLAYAQATAIAEAFAEASAVAETCHKCLAAASLVAYSYEKIFLNATSQIDTSLMGIANGGNTSDTINSTATAFINITVVAFAKVLVEAHAEVDKCASAIQANITTGDTAAANSVTCQLNSSATDDEVVRNASVAVSASVAALVCGEGVANATFEIEAKAIGSAMAIAITEVTLDCQVEGKGTICALAEADMIKTAKAVAYSFAFGYVSATSTCNNLCHNYVSVLTEAIGSVLATATSNSLQGQCTGPDSYFDIHYTETQIVEASITALATILTNATATSEGDCLIGLDIEAAVSPGQEQLVSGPPLAVLPAPEPVPYPAEAPHIDADATHPAAAHPATQAIYSDSAAKPPAAEAPYPVEATTYPHPADQAPHAEGSADSGSQSQQHGPDPVAKPDPEHVYPTTKPDPKPIHPPHPTIKPDPKPTHPPHPTTKPDPKLTHPPHPTTKPEPHHPEHKDRPKKEDSSPAPGRSKRPPAKQPAKHKRHVKKGPGRKGARRAPITRRHHSSRPPVRRASRGRAAHSHRGRSTRRSRRRRTVRRRSVRRRTRRRRQPRHRSSRSGVKPGKSTPRNKRPQVATKKNARSARKVRDALVARAAARERRRRQALREKRAARGRTL